MKSHQSEEALILAPQGRDAAVAQAMLAEAGLGGTIVEDIAALVERLGQGAGFAVVTEEALSGADLRPLADWIAYQPDWSDFPFVLLTQRGGGLERNPAAGRYLEVLGNVTFLERPFHPTTLVSLARSALRGRRRQYDAERHVAALELSESRLRQSEAKYRTLFTTMDEGFCIIEFLDGPDGPLSDYIHVEANDAYERHAGIADVVGQRVREMVPAEAAGWVELYGEVLKTGNSIRFERELQATGRYLELAAFRLEPPERRQVAVLFQDVTSRRQAEIQLQQLNATLEQRIAESLAERKLLADLVEGTDAIVQVIDHDFNILAINRAAIDETEAMLGRRPAVGDNKLDLLSDLPELQARTRSLWQRALDGEAYTEIVEAQDPKGGKRFYEMKFNVLHDPDGRQVGAYQFAYDVTDRLHDQQRLAEATARVHEMAKLETLGQLTGGVAHDFNNLLTPIVGALDMLRRQYESDERSNRLISGAMQAAERATTLVQRLLSFARRQHLESRTVDIKDLVEGMHDLMQRTIGPHITVHLDLASDLPPARVDPGQLELALLNLAVNARDAMGGGGHLHLVLDEAQIGQGGNEGLAPGRYIHLAVSDTGVGMDEATLNRAIEPFFTTKGQGEGTGLGLSMIHGLAAQSGGALRIRSKVGEGTTAELWLPVAEGRADQLEDRDHRLPSQPRRASILLVDDEDLVRAATAEMLRDMGHSVTEAKSGTAALDQLSVGRHFDLLITDYLMPGIRGSELIEEARSHRPQLRALLLTGYANLAKGEAAGLPRLAKPFREADLARVVASLLGDDATDSPHPRLRSV
ncbi:MAG TPA: PAS domain-containing protein [Sphingomicrobium sp.]|nr:PAS domain-containing protein [Sphingomicrobium sp.]